MSIAKEQLINSLDQTLPRELLEGLVSEYEAIKEQFFLGRYQPTELNAARFCEYALRLLEHIDIGTHTPLGKQLDSSKIINRIVHKTSLSDTLRQFVPNQIRILLDVRNKRNVAHVGGEVNPNYSDSVFVVHCSDWIMTEIVREFYICSVEQAREIVSNINEIQIPIVAEFDGFVRVLSALGYEEKALVILYHKHPNKISDSDLVKWTEYSNSTQFKSNILKKLHKKNLVHYMKGAVELTPLGIAYIQKNVPMSALAV